MANPEQLNPDRLEALLLTDLDRAMSGRGFFAKSGRPLSDRERELVGSATLPDFRAVQAWLDGQLSMAHLEQAWMGELMALAEPFMVGHPNRTLGEAVQMMSAEDAQRAHDLAWLLGKD